jgi:hypothetical protein
MPTFKSTTKTAQEESYYKRNVQPSYRTLQSDLKIARFPYTFAGTEATNDIIVLGALGITCRIIPELSRIRDTNSAVDSDVSMKLNVLLNGVTSTDLSGTVAFDQSSIAFTEIAQTELVRLAPTDDLRLIISDAAIGSVLVNGTIVVEIVYIADEAIG